MHGDNLTNSRGQAHTRLGFGNRGWHIGRMTTTEQELLWELKELEAAVAKVNTKEKMDLMVHFDRIDTLAASLPTDTDGELQHYLQKKSYEKARLFLQERFAEIEKGGCLR